MKRLIAYNNMNEFIYNRITIDELKHAIKTDDEYDYLQGTTFIISNGDWIKLCEIQKVTNTIDYLGKQVYDISYNYQQFTPEGNFIKKSYETMPIDMLSRLEYKGEINLWKFA